MNKLMKTKIQEVQFYSWFFAFFRNQTRWQGMFFLFATSAWGGVCNVSCQFYQPTFPRWLKTSWEREHNTRWHARPPSTTVGGIDLQLISVANQLLVANCLTLTWHTGLRILLWFLRGTRWKITLCLVCFSYKSQTHHKVLLLQPKDILIKSIFKEMF